MSIGYTDGVKAYRILNIAHAHGTRRRVSMKGEARRATERWTTARPRCDFTVEHIHFEGARRAGNFSSSTRMPRSMPGSTPTPAAPSPTLEAPSPTLAFSPPNSAATPTLVALSLTSVTSLPATVTPLQTPVFPSSTLAASSLTRVEFVTPLADDEDHLNVNYHDEPLQYRTMENILSVEPGLHLVHEDDEPRSFMETNEQAA